MKNISSVELPEGITVIYDSAFSCCEGLVTVNIPDTVTSVNYGAFQNCSKLKNVVLPDKLETIGNYAFGWCYELNSLTIPQSVKSIGEYAFANIGITTLNIPNGLKKIEDYTFTYCYNLVRVFLPESVTDIGGYAFNEVNNAVFYCSNQDQILYCELKGFKYFDVSQKLELNSNNVVVDTGSAVWNGTKVIPTIYVKLDGSNIPLVEGEDYTAVYKDNVDVGTATATITGKGIFEGEVTKKFTISKAEIGYCWPYPEIFTFDVTLDGKTIWSSTSATSMEKIAFDGKPHTFDVSNVKYNGNLLTKDIDYRVDNYAQDIIFNGGSIYINGLKNLTGSAFVDIPGIESIHIDDLSLEQIKSSVTYNGQKQKPQFKVSYGDYEFPEDCINCTWNEHVDSSWNTIWDFFYADKGKVELTVSGVEGSKIYPYEIKGIDISDASIRFPEEKYYSYGENSPATPNPEVIYKYSENENWSLNYGNDYTITYKNNIETGTATAVVQGVGNYSGSKEVEFQVEKNAQISSYEITLEKDSYTFTGEEIKPVVKEVKVNDVLLNSTDYDIIYGNCISTGSAWMTISGKGEYENFSAQKEFNIVPASVDECEFIVKDVALWTETDVAYPEYEIKLKNGVSIFNVGWTGVDVEYENNVGFGTGKVIFTLKGDVEGTKTVEFQIKRHIGSNLSWSWEDNVPFYEYTGEAITPKVKLERYDGNTWNSLTEGKDYSLSYKDNVNVGRATIIVTGKGQYTGDWTIEFLIDKSNSVVYDKENKVLTISGEGEMKVSKLPEYSQLAEKIVIKEGITTISNSIFYEFTRLKEVEMPDTLKVIGDGAFQSCTSLSNIVIPDSVEEIHYNAFWNCYNLKTINIPASMREIGERAFACTGIENVVVPDNIKTIRQYAFSDCQRLESVVVSPSVTKIEDYAFRYCWSLKKVSLPKELSTAESIGLKTFEDTSSELIVYCNSDYQVDYCEQYGIKHIDARSNYPLTADNVGFYQNNGSVEYNCGETKIALSCNGIKLIEGEDYTAVYENADNVGQAKVTITGIGVYSGTVEKNYKITPADLGYLSYGYDENHKGGYDIYVDDELWENDSVLEFTGKKHTLKIENVWYMSEDNILKEGEDYKISSDYSSNGYDLLAYNIEGIDKYSGNVHIELNVGMVNMSDCEIERLTPAEVVYNYSEQIPEFKITYKGYEFPKEAYNVRWKDSDYNSWDFRSVHSGKVVIESNYIWNNEYARIEGNAEFDYAITPLDISGGKVTFTKDQFVVNPDSEVSDISSFDVAIVVDEYTTYIWYGESTGDLSIEYENNNKVGTATAIIKGKGNCTGELRAEYKVVKDITGCGVGVDKGQYNYTGEAVNAEVIVKDDTRVLDKDKDYTVSYSNNVDEGMAEVTITGIGDYIGTVTANFEICKVSIDDAVIELVPEYDRVLYDGTEKTPSIVLKYGDTVIESSDYDVTYVNNVDEGIATITVTGKNRCKGSRTLDFSIYKNDVSQAEMKLEYDSVLYDGKEKCPTVTVLYDGKELKQGDDYEVSYSSNIEMGKATAIVNGKGSFKNTLLKQFDIYKYKMSEVNAEADKTSFTYDGNVHTPVITVKHNGNVLKQDSDYKLTIGSETEAGEYKAVIEGMGQYSGSVDLIYAIEPIAFDDADVTLKDTIFTYDGSAKKPTVTVIHGGAALVADKDYQLSYKNNIDAGTAYAVIDGINNYSGHIEVSYKILAYQSGMDAVYKEEDTLMDEDYVYHIINEEDKEVEFTAPADKKETNVVVPATITAENGTVYTVTSIGEKAFYKNTNIKKLTIANTVKSIENYAFYGCKNLTTIKIGNGIDVVGDSAFRQCTKLTSITLPKSVDKLGKNCFYGCKKLKTITIKSNQVVDVQKNAIKGVSKKCIIKVPKKLVKKYKKEFDKKSGFVKTMKIKKN